MHDIHACVTRSKFYITFWISKNSVNITLLSPEKERKFTYQPAKLKREDADPNQFEIKFEDSVEYVDGHDLRVNLSSQQTTDELRITNLGTGSYIDLRPSFVSNKFEALNEDYDTIDSGNFVDLAHKGFCEIISVTNKGKF
jgi:hypothetical protein